MGGLREVGGWVIFERVVFIADSSRGFVFAVAGVLAVVRRVAVDSLSEDAE
jgi:hypothetical protein